VTVGDREIVGVALPRFQLTTQRPAGPLGRPELSWIDLQAVRPITGAKIRFMFAAGSSADAGGTVWTSTRRGASIWAAISSWRNDHEKAQYDWDRRWCRVIGGGALVASVVPRECGPCGATANGVTR